MPTVVNANTSPLDSDGTSTHSVNQDSHSPRVACSVRSCSKRRCLTCPALKPESTFRSSVTGKSYKVIGTEELSCDSAGVVYLITCKRCGLQYVGETSQALKRRMNNHRASIRSLQPQFLYKHFNSNGHSADDVEIQPIEKIVSGSDDNASIHARRLEREDFWMRELKTIYPYGLNDNIRGLGNISKLKNEPVVWRLFNKRTRTRKRSGKRPKRAKPTGPAGLREWLMTKLGSYKSSGFLKQYVSAILSFKTIDIKQIRTLVEEFLHLNAFPIHLLLILKDLVRFRLGDVDTCEEVPSSKSSNRHFVKITFHNKGIEMINLSQILHSRRVTDTVPTFFEDKEPPGLCYKYTKTIAPTIFNFRKVSKTLDINKQPSGCECSSPPYVYGPLGHIVTGDLSLIANRKLRGIIRKGPNFREQNNIDWDLCLKLCLEGVRKYARKWTAREGVDRGALGEWVATVKELVEEKIERLKKRGHNTRKRKILHDPKCSKVLEKLHKKYVLVPADKASNNVVIIMQRLLQRSVEKRTWSDKCHVHLMQTQRNAYL